MNLNYTFTSAIVRDLMAIEAPRQTVTLMVLPLKVTERLRRKPPMCPFRATSPRNIEMLQICG